MSSDEWVCAICLEDNADNCFKLDPCQHQFHTACIVEHFRRGKSFCPLCRNNPLPKKNNYINYYHIDWDYDDFLRR